MGFNNFFMDYSDETEAYVIEDVDNISVTFDRNNIKGAGSMPNSVAFKNRMHNLKDWHVDYDIQNGKTGPGEYICTNIPEMRVEIDDDLVLDLDGQEFNRSTFPYDAEAYLRGDEKGYSLKELVSIDGLFDN